MKSFVDKFFTLFFHLFALSGILFIPFTFKLFPFQVYLTDALFSKPIMWAHALFPSLKITNSAISSDSTTMYLMFVVLGLLTFLIALSLCFWKGFEKYQSKFIHVIQLIAVYYLAVLMLKYGFDKLFKAQFYLPEPNTLYTPLGMLDKDILYWSTMGTSYSYNMFMGLMEIIPALLLLYRKTRIFGLFILSGVLLQVMFVNFSFDISVKLLSSFLWFLTLLLLTPSLKSIIQFFIHQQASTLSPFSGKSLLPSSVYRLTIKAIVIVLFFFETLYPYMLSGHYNDDVAPRNYLHGAYEVTEINANDSSVILPPIKRVFIHRRNYFIFQYSDDTMEDFFLEISQVKGTFKLTDYEENIILLHYTYQQDIGELTLRSEELGWHIHTKVLPWKELLLMQPLFHWTVDEVK